MKNKGNRSNRFTNLTALYNRTAPLPAATIYGEINIYGAKRFQLSDSPSYLVDNARSFARNGRHKYGIRARGAFMLFDEQPPRSIQYESKQCENE